jgi:uncharacterized protein (TIGR00255 family)
MTGFGRGAQSVHGKELVVEVKSVNHKGCDVFVRTSQELSALEPQIIQLIKEKVQRGRFDVTAFFTKSFGNGAGCQPAQINLEALETYRDSFKKIAKKMKLAEPDKLETYLNLPGVLVQEAGPAAVEWKWNDVKPVVEAALKGLLEMRSKEGAKLQKDIVSRMKFIEKSAKSIKKLAPQSQKEQEEHVYQELKRILAEADTKVDGNILASVAKSSLEQTDITEEIVRVESHIVQFSETVKTGQAAGRKLDFIFQELFREFNTMGSKTPHSEIGRIVVDVKTELDKLKQQIANIE